LKISALYPKRDTAYPQIRLPQQYTDIFGQIAHIFEIEHSEDRVFLVVVGKGDRVESAAFEIGDKVLKPNVKF
jgi:hypothetical protein